VTMDAVRENLPRAMAGPRHRDAPAAYYLATVHRQENVDDDARLRAILGALEAAPLPVVLPLHPRTRGRMEALGLRAARVRLVPPQPYLAMLRLVKEASAVLTDSGGVQKEAFLLGTPCVTMRRSTEWTETLGRGANRLVVTDPAKIRTALRAIARDRPRWSASRTYGDGHAAERIAAVIARFLEAPGSRSRPR